MRPDDVPSSRQRLDNHYRQSIVLRQTKQDAGRINAAFHVVYFAGILNVRRGTGFAAAASHDNKTHVR